MAKAEPIRDTRQVRAIMDALENDRTKIGQRRYLLFMTGIFTGRRVSDIVRLRVRDVRGRDRYTFTEKKTGKRAEIWFPRKLKAAYAELLAGMDDNDWVFPSDKKDRRTGKARHITTRTAYNYMREVKALGGFDEDESISTHTMRKTFGYHYYRQYKDIGTLMSLFNHSEAGTTLIYIGIASDERKAVARKVDSMYDGDD